MKEEEIRHHELHHLTAASVLAALSRFTAAPATCRQPTPPHPPELSVQTGRLWWGGGGGGRVPDKAGRI